MIGGVNSTDASKYLNEVWRYSKSTDSFLLICANAPWVGRKFHAVQYADAGHLVLMGGQDSISNSLSDSWLSIDDGVHWTLMNSAGWGGSNRHGMFSWSMNGIIFIAQGYSTTTSSIRQEIFQSADYGKYWSMAASSTAAFIPRRRMGTSQQTHTHIHTYIHTHIHTSIHTCIYTAL